MISTKAVEMYLPRTTWLKLNRLWTVFERLYSFIHKQELAASPNCKCDASEQTADHILKTWSDGSNDETRCWLKDHHYQDLIRAIQRLGVVKGQAFGPSPVCV